MLDLNSIKILLDGLPNGIIYCELEDEETLKFRILYANNAICELTKFNIKEHVGLTLREAFPPLYIDESRQPKIYLQAILTQKTIEIGEFEYGDDNLEKKSYIVSAIPYEKSRILIWVSDIQDLKNTRLKLKIAKLKTKQTEEKNVLLKEIHHRVKNNLQVLVSLLRIQSKFHEDKNVKECLNQTLHRIKSAGIMQNIIFESKKLSKINLKKLIEKQANALFQHKTGVTKDLKIKADVHNIRVNIDTIVPIGLLINEIISSINTEVDPNKDKIISVSIKHLSQNNYQLSIFDQCFKRSLINLSDNTLEMKIINLLMRQIEGRFSEVTSTKGTEYIIAFKEIKSTSPNSLKNIISDT